MTWITRSSRATLAACALLGAAACARANTAAAGAAPAVAANDSSLAGDWRWVTLGDRPAPVEFPAGSGATLVGGTLALRPMPRDSAGFEGRFSLRFTMKRTPADSARGTGEDGRYRVAGDSLLFTPAGREGRPPVRFTRAWRAGGILALTDAQGNVWGYVRR